MLYYRSMNRWVALQKAIGQRLQVSGTRPDVNTKLSAKAIGLWLQVSGIRLDANTGLSTNCKLFIIN